MVGVDVLPAGDWINRIRDLAGKAASLIPIVGQAASAILSVFWPEHTVNIFESIKQDVDNLARNLIDKGILAKELEECQNEVDALRDVIKEYLAAHTVEKRSWLTNWIEFSLELRVKLQKSSNKIQLILPTITLALLHLLGLRERLNFGKEIYGEDNSVVWKKDLEQAYHDYVVVYFPDIFKEWKVWRADQVVIQKWSNKRFTTLPPFFAYESHATIEDKITGVKKQYNADYTTDVSRYEDITNGRKTKFCNDAYTEMAGYLSATFEFNTIVPFSQDPPYDKELFGRMFLGPYSEEILRAEPAADDSIYRKKLDDNDYDINTGSLKQMVIREYNTIDAMQFIYANGSGRLAGNGDGGEEHRVDVNNMDGLRMGFSNNVLCFVEVSYRDGTKSSTFGNRGHWRTSDAFAKCPPGYELRSWSYGENYGPSHTLGIGVLQLQYEISSALNSDIKSQPAAQASALFPFIA